MSISSGISIPFILVAFNQDRITRWGKKFGKVAVWWIGFAVIVGILLPVIWTTDLASGIKAAVTVTLVLCVIVGAMAQFIYWLVASVSDYDDSSLVED